MAEREIVKYPDPVLRRPAVSIAKPDSKIKVLASDMAATLRQVHALGLAANQVGVLQKVIVFDDGSGLGILVNPKVVSAEGEQIGFEGCLSFPGLQGEVMRAERVEVRAHDIKGKPVKIMAEGLLARILQHEIDHLNGTLFIDRAIPDSLQYVTNNSEDEEQEEE